MPNLESSPWACWWCDADTKRFDDHNFPRRSCKPGHDLRHIAAWSKTYGMDEFLPSPEQLKEERYANHKD